LGPLLLAKGVAVSLPINRQSKIKNTYHTINILAKKYLLRRNSSIFCILNLATMAKQQQQQQQTSQKTQVFLT